MLSPFPEESVYRGAQRVKGPAFDSGRLLQAIGGAIVLLPVVGELVDIRQHRAAGSVRSPQRSVVPRQHLGPVAQHGGVVGVQIDVAAHGPDMGSRIGNSAANGQDTAMPDRLARAAAFVTALQAASRRNPNSWRPVSSIGRGAGITDPDELKQAARDAERAGLVERWADGSHVLLTAEGRGAAAD